MTKKPLFAAIRPEVQFPNEELKVLEFWEREKIFEKSVSQNDKGKHYSFYDGPPFATGLPHYGHLLAGTIKDIIPRYWTMQGFTVPRRFGWDCHGVPVEFEINKSLGLQSRKDILNYGVAKYNAACRSIVDRYAHEWKRTVKRVGRWVDMDKPYFTMDVEFMQSVWNVFQELYKKGLIYEGYKVVPYSTGISTPLSNFEANLNYKDVQDPAITVAFPLVEQSDVSILAWTTTPWTLPSNMALAVNRDVNYLRIKSAKTGHSYWIAEALKESFFPSDGGDWQEVEKGIGAQLLNLEYEPPYDFFAAQKTNGAFRVIHSDHVTLDSGTGVVHMAPAFGEDDFYACTAQGIPFVNPVDDDGVFTNEVPLYAGQKVKDADKEIIRALKEKGILFKQDTLMHSYPFCYRSDQPLIYKAVSSWFVAVEKIKDVLVQANQETRWVPSHLRDGRFGKWLENARDWAISRNRFWGTPIPIWRNEEGEMICVGSRAELEKLSGQKVHDLHKEFVDQISIPSPTGKSPLKRVDAVLDCWFESGSMPYAQLGYPFSNQEEFKAGFPADFIAEGLDQTRGWFYTLMVISSALFGKAPFKNVVVNGLVLAEDGKKMSKSLRNYPDPDAILSQHGADALRLYLIDSPVVKGQELRFSDKGVRDIVRRIMLRWWNAYSFFVNYANIDGFHPRGDCAATPNILDRYILSRLQGLLETTEREMAQYRLDNVVPALLTFVEDLTNSYIRFNRSHFWQEEMTEEKRFAFETLFHTLTTLAKCMAPFAPFLSETIYQNLKMGLPNSKESVHLESFPKLQNDNMGRDLQLESGVQRMEEMVTLARNYRERISVKAKIPLRKLTVIHRDPLALKELKRLEPYFVDEINVQSVDYRSDEDQFVSITAKANFPLLGKRLGPKMKSVAAAIQALDLTSILKLEAGEILAVAGESIQLHEVEIRRAPKAGNDSVMTSQWITIDLDPTVTPEQAEEGAARSVLRKIQLARRAAGLNYDQRINLQLNLPAELRTAVEKHIVTIRKESLALMCEFVASCVGTHVEKAEVDGENIEIGLSPV